MSVIAEGSVGVKQSRSYYFITYPYVKFLVNTVRFISITIEVSFQL